MFKGLKTAVGVITALILCVLLLCACVNTKPEESSVDTSSESAPSKSEESTESQISEDISEVKDDITKDTENYSMEIKYNDDGTMSVTYAPKAQDYTKGDETQPFRNIFGTEPITVEMNPSRAYNERTKVEYTKREGGTWIYSNNPEMLAAEDLGQALLRTEKMNGEYTFTFEHSNRTGTEGYFGYQLKNTGDTDAVVTVTNIGLQVNGEWLGQRSWSDYFGVELKLPFDYFLENGKLNPIYVGCDYVKYTPEKSVTETYTVPAGEYIYVLGGTTEDSWQNISVGGTADRKVYKGKCVNGAVKFSISGSEMQGSFYFYSTPSQVKAEPKEQGYIVRRNDTDYSAQYKGIDRHQGLIESNLTFAVNDLTRNGKLPVYYERSYDETCRASKVPYREYSPVTKKYMSSTWVTSLNPNTSTTAIGTDMMTFECVTTDGKTVTIDNLHADGDGDPANTGNWMVQYTDNFTFINAGEKARTFKIYKRGASAGALLVIVRDYNGKVLDSQMITQPYFFTSLDAVFAGVDKSLLVQKNGLWWFKTSDGVPFCDVLEERALCYSVTVDALSASQVSVDFLILGNSNGGISHWVEVSDAE